ncbi:hypothetical protein [Simplicispira lacusdiani]|uniref:hypothetical protein n=1 Tax=Simplicispira lacusdiani TaxID=2213010 RepID=UPI00130026E0|nr:hypothetical protein [Simplicispira lacusdiani]
MTDNQKNELQNVNLGRTVGSRYFLLSAGGHRDKLMSMHAELNLPGSTLKKLKINPLDDTPDIERWLWESSKEYCVSDYPLEEVERFLHNNIEAINCMRKYRETLSLNICLCWKFIENELHGFYASSELMHLLSSAGLGLDIDIANWN